MRAILLRVELHLRGEEDDLARGKIGQLVQINFRKQSAVVAHESGFTFQPNVLHDDRVEIVPPKEADLAIRRRGGRKQCREQAGNRAQRFRPTLVRNEADLCSAPRPSAQPPPDFGTPGTPESELV